jgi:hypothetical protein
MFSNCSSPRPDNSLLVRTHRELFPVLLKKSDRGKFHDPFAAPARYGEQIVSEGVDDVELLDAYERGEITIDEEGSKPCAAFLTVTRISSASQYYRTAYSYLVVRTGGVLVPRGALWTY